MSFDREVIYNVAKLARIRVAEEKIDNLANTNLYNNLDYNYYEISKFLNIINPSRIFF